MITENFHSIVGTKQGNLENKPEIDLFLGFLTQEMLVKLTLDSSRTGELSL